MSPSLRPALISVYVSPTTPVMTSVGTCWPFERTVTIELPPVVRTAALGTRTALSALATVTDAFAVIPSRRRGSVRLRMKLT